jgi:beta-ureidopropionase
MIRLEKAISGYNLQTHRSQFHRNSEKGDDQMPKQIRIGAAQMGPSSLINDRADKKGNVRRILELLEKGIKEKVRIICFPELCLTDYFAARLDRDYEEYFDQIPNDLTRNIFELTKEHPISVILPYAEYDGVSYYNSAGIIDKGRLIGKYRKVHLPGCSWDPEKGEMINHEKTIFTPGNLGYPVFDLQGVKVGVQICYDRDFPEGYRALALKGAQIVFNPTALSYRAADHASSWRMVTWEPFLKVRSIENNLFVVGLNKAGQEKERYFPGETIVLNPMGGVVMARTQTQGDELLVVEIDLDDVIKARKMLPIFRDLSPLDLRGKVE